MSRLLGSRPSHLPSFSDDILQQLSNDDYCDRFIIDVQQDNNQLCYCRGTARRATLVNSCYVSRGMGVRFL